MNYADKRVLIIEDQRPFLLVLRGLLHSMGATEVVTKSSAEQALSLCRKRKFDIIISDLHLGSDKKNGFEFIEELRSQKLAKPSAIVMLISADSTRPFVLGSLERAPDDYLIKPFSQAQIKSRLSRAWQKRQTLLPVYQALFDDNITTARKEAERLFKNNVHYRGSLAQILVEIYWKLNAYDKVTQILNEFDQTRPVPWIQTALARNCLKMGDIDKARSLAEKITEKQRFNADAMDIIAECQNAQKDGEGALSTIRNAIRISPYSVARHTIACTLARANQDYPLASESAQAIWLLSRKTTQQHASLWCGYIRSLLDVAEHAAEKKIKNKYQQEAMLAMQRGKFDDYLSRQNADFDFVIYEHIISSRIYSLDGKFADAKRALVNSQDAIAYKYDEYPSDYAPDSLKAMLDLGDFEDAEELSNLLRKQGVVIDHQTQQLIDADKQKASEKQRNYAQHNREGINHYQSGDYKAAHVSFGLALKYSPVNTGVALNLLQCVLKLLSANAGREPALMSDCRRLKNLLDGLPMKEQFMQKYKELQDDLSSYVGKAA